MEDVEVDRTRNPRAPTPVVKLPEQPRARGIARLEIQAAHPQGVALEFAVEAAEATARNSNLEVAFTQADFRKNETFRGMERVDVSLLYDVLLHQENYLEVIGNVCDTTNQHICFAQPCLQERLFFLPDSTTLLQFWSEELKTELRKNSFWPVVRTVMAL